MFRIINQITNNCWKIDSCGWLVSELACRKSSCRRSASGACTWPTSKWLLYTKIDVTSDSWVCFHSCITTENIAIDIVIFSQVEVGVVVISVVMLLSKNLDVTLTKFASIELPWNVVHIRAESIDCGIPCLVNWNGWRCSDGPINDCCHQIFLKISYKNAI